MAAIEQVKMSDKEVKRMVDEIMKKKQDLLRVEGKDPEMSYYWVSNEKKRVEQRKAEGFIPVGSDPRDKDVKTLASKITPQHELGDLVLMKRPKVITQEIRRRQAEQRRALKTKVQSELREDISRLGKGIAFEKGKEDTDN